MRDESSSSSNADVSFLLGGGEMGARIREKDWSKTSLGSPECWQQSLKTAVRIMLTSRQAMFVWWGEELINLYNDAYKTIVGGKHPEVLGQPASYVWREIWAQVGPRAESVLLKNEGTYDEALLLIMERNGYPEETYYTFSYSPVPNDQGGTGGIICANTDDTQRIIGERQLALLRELAARTADARTFDQACTLSAKCLETNPYDLPFAMIYLVEPDKQHIFLAGTCGINRGQKAVPESVALDSDSVWPFAEVIRTQKAGVISDLTASFGNLPTGAWNRAPHQAVAVPIAPSGQTGRSGILIAGLNPFRLFDDNYRRFIDLVSAQIAASVANANAYEEERKRSEALAELDRAKTTFFSNISHEFRTPLTLILGPLEDLLGNRSESLPLRDRQQLETVYRNSQRLLKLVNTLLDFSRIESGRVQASYEPTDLSSFTSELASVFRSAIERASLSLVVNCPPLPEPVYVDRDMWEKVVLNLLSNAFKFTFEGEIVVCLSWKEGHVELTVGDTGIGIPEKELPHLFERFHRVEGASGRNHEGSGIGLALVQEIVKLHGGTVAVASQLGVGTTFTISVPTGSAHLPAERISASQTLASTAMSAASYVEEALRWLPDNVSVDTNPWVNEQEVSHQGSATKDAAVVRARILLADDNADMRNYLSRLLLSRYEVSAVADGATALVAAQEQVPDLVLSDVMMPGLNGFELLRELRNHPRTRDVPFILLSARAGEEARIEGLEAGADDYLVKPFSARELLARVGAVLELSQLRQETTRREQQLRTEAESANRMKDEFLATLSHELRSPLNAMVGWTSLLRSRKFDEATVSRALETIERNARVQVQLVEDLLDVSRIIRGQLRLAVRPLELIPVIEAAIDVVRPAAEAKEIRLQSVLDPSAGPISGDSDRLQQIIWNLLTNAVKFTPKKGRVQIRLERINSHVEIVVTDTGQGISAEFLPYVFDRFRQADNSITRSYNGLGLGLAIVRHLVELHGGTVHADSPGEGLGATFTVKLPLIAVNTNTSELERVHPMVGSGILFDGSPRLDGLQILVVDDEADARRLLVYILEECGARVMPVAGTNEAILALTDSSLASRFDVLVTDIGMPSEDGYALLRRVRALEPQYGKQIPAVVLSAYARAEDRRAALLAGFQAHVAKPVEPAELVAVIANLTGRTGN